MSARLNGTRETPVAPEGADPGDTGYASMSATPASLDAAAFTRQARTVRELCGATPAVCAECLLVLEVDPDAEELICRDCGGRWPADSLAPCPRAATVRVCDEDGAEDRLCASHAAVWRRLVARARETLTTAANPTKKEIEK